MPARETYRATGDVRFGEDDTPLEALPPRVQACIRASAAGTSTPGCDALMGSLAAGRGFCADRARAASSYCACVNAPVPLPECVFGPCAVFPRAYKTAAMQRAMAHPEQGCPDEVNCATLQVMGGPANLAPGVDAPRGCFGPRYWVIEHLTPIVFFLILVTILAVLVGYDAIPRRREAAQRAAAAAAPPSRA